MLLKVFPLRLEADLAFVVADERLDGVGPRTCGQAVQDALQEAVTTSPKRIVSHTTCFRVVFQKSTPITSVNPSFTTTGMNDEYTHLCGN